MGSLIGLALPVAKTPGGYFRSVEDREVIAQSLRMIIGTRPGERYHLPGFGSRVTELIFEPNDRVVASLAEVYVRSAVSRWEPRVEILQVQTILDDRTIHLVLQYRIRGARSLEETLEYSLKRLR